MKRLIYCIFAFLLTACANREQTCQVDPQEDLILRVQGSDRLYTTEYVIHKIVTYDDIVRLQGQIFNKEIDIKLPQPTRKVLIPMEARVKAYIDFSDFGPDNVVFGADSTVRVILPEPKVELTSTRIDHSGVREYVDYGRSRFTSAELSEYEQQGRAAIISSIPQLDIIETARLHAYNFMLPMLETMGYKRENITIDFSDDFSSADYLKRIIKTQSQL